MLDQVKKSISELPNISFEEYFQGYVLEVESKVSDYSVNEISKQNVTIEDLSYLIKGINSLTEELRNNLK